MNPYARDKAFTKAGVLKPDISEVTDEELARNAEDLRGIISQASSLRAYYLDQLNKRRKRKQREAGSHT